MGKKKVKKLEKKLKYCFDILINLSLTVSALQTKLDKQDGLVDLTLNNHAKIVYDIVKD